MSMIGVIDYQAGNLKSVETALKYLEADFIISGNPDELRKTEKLIFPGVGEARAAMDVLHNRGLDDVVKWFAEQGRLVLGICLGCQIILDYSEERETECLGIIPGRVKRFPSDSGLKVPHMGWNKVRTLKDHWIFRDIPQNSTFYFVHSYYPSPGNSEDSLSVTEYGFSFSSGVCRENVIAFQFHPEKSGKYGLTLLNNFVTA
jgi:glutamine amidotransferase